ncbi:MAG: glycosyltransferase family 1 protein, partial [Sphingobacteriales bacterium]
MKVCFIVGAYPKVIGGAEFQAMLLAEALRYKYEIFYISCNEFEDGEIALNGLKVYQVKISSTDRNTFYLKIFYRIQTILQKERPDKIYHRAVVPYSVLLARFASKRNIDFITHIASEHSLTFNTSISSKLKLWCLRKLCLYSKRVIVQTQQQYDMLSSSVNIRGVLLPNFQERVHALSATNNSGIKKVVWIGKSTPIKQLELFLQVAESCSNLNTQFVCIVKRLQDDYSKALFKRAFQLPNLTLIEGKENDFINAFLAKETFLLINTSMSEGFSNTFIQAWMRGVPVISLNSDPNNLLVEENLGSFCEGNLSMIKKYIEH